MLKEMKTLCSDVWLHPYFAQIDGRRERITSTEDRITGGKISLKDFSQAHHYFGLHKTAKGWVFREYAPNAHSIYLCGDFSDWKIEERFKLTPLGSTGQWELKLPTDAIKHEDLYHLLVQWDGGEGTRLPAYVKRVVQDESSKIFTAQVWEPKPYVWKHKAPTTSTETPLIYEAHVGMAQEKEGLGTYDEFREKILPKVIAGGYNVLQLMAIQEHPYYGSFGYHVANYFASSSRFGTPEQLKHLIDEAHAAGLQVIMDIVHSHSVKNELESLAQLDGTDYLYFHSGAKGYHTAWDSCCFDYGKTHVLHLLLSNCRFWLEEYQFDGYRFDGVTSMLYFDHGLGRDFGSYDSYFDGGIDVDAEAYLGLANKLIHTVKPAAITIAEDMSGLPGLGSPLDQGGLGFDFKLAMGTPDFWYKILKQSDSDWNVEQIWQELTNRRRDEKSVTYVECHDQAIVGSKNIIFELLDAEMYSKMDVGSQSLIIDRGIALHKMIRLVTLATGGDGYLNFMGNEFGHPEWIDFPREGNNWSYKYARRQWNLVDNDQLRYHFLNQFDQQIIGLFNQQALLKHEPQLWHVHCGDQVLAFERGDYLFIFNFSPEHSYSDYEISVHGSEFELLFSSDDVTFNGFNRLIPGQKYIVDKDCGKSTIKVYLPNRTVSVLKKNK
ncbi:MAG: alpha amylase C-terminal domain-containing protein [Lentisphaeria bacterium]|nr:alpha amylase C-terminal domain-containing protein [Lentisphaeria bacterium]